MSDIHIGTRIRELREIQNYTREAFAEKIEISSKFLYEIETGKKGVSADTLCKISQALSVSCDYIMFGEEVSCKRNEKLVCVLEKINPAQASKMHDILQILYEMLDILKTP